MINVTMNAKSISIDYIDIDFTPNIDNLIKDNIYILVNETNFTDFHLTSITETETLYRITPYSKFNIYDEITISITKPNYVFNTLKISLSKYVYNGDGLILYNCLANTSGIANLGVLKVNDVECLINCHDIVVCKGVNSSLSNIKSDKETYNSGDTAQITVSLFDKDDLTVPNGKYVLKLYMEKI